MTNSEHTSIRMKTVDSERKSRRSVAVDLFCGAGGLSFGMKQAGIEICAGIDSDPACRYPFEANVGAKFHKRDVAEISPDFVGSLFPDECERILAGCAPCQPFSSYTNRTAVRERDWQLLVKFGEMVSALKPDIVTMENVSRLERYPIFEEFLRVLEDADYEHSCKVVRCAEYGVPQTRRRLVLLASRLGKIHLAPATHSADEFQTVADTIRHLEGIEAGGVSASDPMHRSSGLSKKNLDRIRSSKPGGTWRDWGEGLRADCHARASGRTFPSVYGRMKWDEPGPTVTTQFHGFGNGRFGHPAQDRAISLREGALLQTFPEDYSFVPTTEEIRIDALARMIGNAVPVKLGEAIGRSIVGHLETRHE